MLSTRYSYQTLIKLENSRQIFEKSSYKIFMKTCTTGTEFVHADRQTDGQTDMTKLIAAFRKFANAPDKE